MTAEAVAMLAELHAALVEYRQILERGEQLAKRVDALIEKTLELQREMPTLRSPPPAAEDT